MRRILLFPFRAIGFLLWLVFFPWYLRLFFALPWWILALVAAGLASIALSDFQRIAEKQDRLDRALSEPEPAIVALSAFDPARDASALGEVRLAVPSRDVLEVQELTVPGPDMAYLPVLSRHPDEVGAVLLTVKLRQGRVAEALDGAAKGLPVVTVHGVLEATSHRESIVRLLRQDGFAVADDVPFLDPIIDTRARGLARAFGTSNTIAYLATGLSALIGLMAFWRLLRWNKRTRPLPAKPMPARHRSTPAPQQGPWGDRTARQKSAQVPKADVQETPQPKVPAEPVATRAASQPKSARQPRSPRQMVDEAFGDILTRHKR